MGFRDERGEGKFGTLFGLMVLAVFIYLGAKVVPILISVYEFRDSIEEESHFAAMPRHDEEVIKHNILQKARELELPVGAKDVIVSRSSTRIDIKVKYTVPIETPVYTYKWSLDESLSAPIF